MRKVKLQLTQPMHDADGNVLHQPGELFDEGDKLLKDLPPGSFKPVIVDDEDEKADKADEKPAAATSRPAAGKGA
jgi:hypothetical protein